jgi:hypothetical protein
MAGLQKWDVALAGAALDNGAAEHYFERGRPRERESAVTVPLVPDLNPNPWTPPTGGDSSQTQTEVEDPALYMIWTDVADYVPTTVPNSGGSGEGTPANPLIAVDLASVRTAETELYNTLGGFVDQYSNLDSDASAAIGSPSFFGQQATYSVEQTVYGSYSLQIPTYSTVTYADGIQTYASTFASSIEPSITIALSAAAGAIEAVGQFAALLQAGGFAYASADSASALPQPVAPPLVPTDKTTTAPPLTGP